METSKRAVEKWIFKPLAFYSASGMKRFELNEIARDPFASFKTPVPAEGFKSYREAFKFGQKNIRRWKDGLTIVFDIVRVNEKEISS